MTAKLLSCFKSSNLEFKKCYSSEYGFLCRVFTRHQIIYRFKVVATGGRSTYYISPCHEFSQNQSCQDVTVSMQRR